MPKMTELLQKLIAHEQSARAIGNTAEAEAFAMKIADLMFRHNLSMSDVEIKQQEQDEPIDREIVELGGSALSGSRYSRPVSRRRASATIASF
jgi:hypothetical protein